MPQPAREEADKYHKHQHILEKFSNVEKSAIWKLLVECWREDIRELQRGISTEKDEIEFRWKQGKIKQLEECLDYVKTKVVEARDFIKQFHEQYGEVKGAK